MRYLSNVSPSIATVLKPAGLEKSKGLITAYYGKDPTDAKWKDDPGMMEWKAFCDKYMSQTEFLDANAAYAFGAAGTLIQVLKQCGADLSRDNVMKQADEHQGSELAAVAAGHAHQHLADQLQSDPPDATRELRRPELAALRRVVDGLSAVKKAQNTGERP